jgi:hypothetical protein
VRRLLARSDALIEELEVLNLREIDQVDARCLLRLEELLRSLPFVCDACAWPPSSPTEALDLLFDLQRGLLAVKNGPSGPSWLSEPWDD